MNTTPEPMDPERLLITRREVEISCRATETGALRLADMLRELLADRDYHAQRAAEVAALLDWQAEVIRTLRARVRVEAEDVERVGVTWAHAVAWAKARGGYIDRLYSGTAEDIAAYAGSGTWRGKCGLDILDEMAAMPLGGEL
jgi:hypothetical protein